MATLELAYLCFGNTMKQVVNYYALDGVVYKYDDYRLARIGILFKFKCNYLSIHDDVQYDWDDLNRETIMNNTVRHLRDIAYQFNYYFNGIWC